jgi:predicted membrane protein DUF2238
METASPANKLWLGDWGPVVRDPLDLLRVAYVVAAIAYVSATGHGAANLAASSVAVVGARFVDLPRLYDLAFIGAMTLTGWGDALGLYDRFTHYDTVVHFLVPATIAPIVYILLARAEVLPRLHDTSERRHHIGVFVVTLSLGLAIGALWEIFEWTSDHVFGSHLVLGEQDTVSDLVADGCGAAVGGLLLLVWSIFGWGSERRVPAVEARQTVAVRDP